MLPDDEALRYQSIGCAIAVHTEKGPGLDEVVYHEMLSSFLERNGIKHLSRARRTLLHRGIVADHFEADLLIPDRLVLELKVLWGNHPPDHFCQMLSYLKFWRIHSGLLFDFGKERLRVRRLSWTDLEPRTAGVEDWMSLMVRSASHRALALTLKERLLAILAEYGLGYRDSTYRGLIAADLTAEGLHCVNQPVVNIELPGGRIHPERFDCVVIGRKAAVLVGALHDEISPAACARLRSYLRYLDLPWGIVANFGKRIMAVQLVSYRDE